MIPPDVVHWHGAAPDRLFIQLAFQEVSDEGAGTQWLEKVGDTVWFNPGVIGMPANDGTADVWYGLIWLEAGDLRLATRRLAYDHLGAAAALRRAGHADGYARTLVTGLWPSLDVLPPASAPPRAEAAPAHDAPGGNPRALTGPANLRLRIGLSAMRCLVRDFPSHAVALSPGTQAGWRRRPLWSCRGMALLDRVHDLYIICYI